MNAFENIVGQLLEEEDYWIRQSVKVEISKDDKRRLDKLTMPRPEIDIVAFNVKKNELLFVECKSLIDSNAGVRYGAIFPVPNQSKKDKSRAKHYKLFTDKAWREIVSDSMSKQYLKQGLIKKNTKIKYALAAGKILVGQEVKLKEAFRKAGWILYTPEMIAAGIRKLAEKGWEDNAVTMTAKLITRNEKKRSAI